MRTEEEMIAYALEADVSLLPHMPELLADLEELGSDAELIAEVIGDLALPGGARVIDLGCGKGAVAVEIARALGFDVIGVDLFEPFIESCEQLARSHGVADSCRFIQGDIVKLAGKLPPADVVVFAALGDVLGSLDKSIRVIRQYVKSGSYLVINDDFVKPGGSTDFPRFESYVEHRETVDRLTAAGDRLVREVLLDADETEDSESELIAARAEAIAKRHPEAANAVREFAASQRAEIDYMARNLISAVWVLERK